LALAVAAGGMAVGAAVAATGASHLPAAVQRLLDCRSTASAPERLACYDQAVDDLGRMFASGEIVVVDKARVATVKRQAFGLNLPSLSLFDRDDRPAQLEEISAVATRAWRQGDGNWVVELEDGAVWAQTDEGRLARSPRAGSKVEIKKGAMGSFFMNLDGQRAVRARRIQ